MITYLLQKEPYLTDEKNIIRYGQTKYNYITASISELDTLPTNKPSLIPLGSVEFVNTYASKFGITIPTIGSYPASLISYLKRQIRIGKLDCANDFEFIKPMIVKQFTGGIKKTITESIQPDTIVWISEPVIFQAEFRCYIHNHKLVGWSQYDDSEEDRRFDQGTVISMINDYHDQPIGYSIDVGLVNGETVLIEVNDGWSLGYYQWGNMNPNAYIQLITDRWIQICHGI